MLAPARYSTSNRKWLLCMNGSESTLNLVPVFPPGVIYHFLPPLRLLMASYLIAGSRDSSNSAQHPVAALATSVITRWLHFVSIQWLHGGGPEFENGGRRLTGTRKALEADPVLHLLTILHFREWLSG